MNPLDGILLKNIAARHGLALAQRYQRLPLFLIPGDLSLFAEQEMDLLHTIGDGDDALHLPYPDLLLDFPAGSLSFLKAAFGDWPMDRGHLWVRVRNASHLLTRQEPDILSLVHLQTLQNLIAEKDGLPPLDQWVLIEGWEEKTFDGTFPPQPDFILSPLTSGAQDFGCLLYGYPNRFHLEGRLAGLWCNLKHCTLPLGDTRREPCRGSDTIMSAIARLTMLALAYLTAGVSLTVKVRPRDDQPLKPHVAREKPWLASRPHYLLIDPDRVVDLGHPSGGSHRSPTPHARRGHWRRLPEGYRKRQTWVSDAWVGATEWESDRAHYKILLEKKGKTDGRN